MKRLYISDLDGTLLNTAGVLSKETEKLLKELLLQGMNFTIASGRSPLTASALLKNLPLTLPMVLLNGALIFDPLSKKNLHSVPFTETQRTILRKLEDTYKFSGFQIGSHDANICYSLPQLTATWKLFFQKYQLNTTKNTFHPETFSSNKDYSLLYAIYADNHPQQLANMYHLLKETGLFVLDFYQDLYLPETWFLEIYSKHASKGSALRTLKDFCPFDHITSFGNGENDISLFEESDYGCAVENASASLIPNASQLIPGCEEDGVAKYLSDAFHLDSLFQCLKQTPSITDLAMSIRKQYHLSHTEHTLALADDILQKNFRNIVFILFDGLGTDILKKHLPEHSFLRTHMRACLNSVFPPTTTAAATALESGLYPAQSGYLGWSVYWPDLKKNVQLYLNLTDDGDVASSVHLAENHLYSPLWIYEIQQKEGIPSFYIAKDRDIRANSLEELQNAIENLVTSDGKHAIYAYLNNPDHLLHKEGTSSQNIHDWLQKADKLMQHLAENCPDTLFLLTADHGFTDIIPLCLEDYPVLKEMLELPPSIEPRSMNLFIKKGVCKKEFTKLFHKVTQNTYRLYTKDEVLKDELFGPPPFHPMFPDMLGDFLAVAQTPLTLFPNRAYMKSMIAGHGGMTTQELHVPLIIWEGN